MKVVMRVIRIRFVVMYTILHIVMFRGCCRQKKRVIFDNISTSSQVT